MRKRLIILLTCLLIGVLSFAAGTLAWLGLDQNTIITQITGKLVTEYFHCGSGTENDPFVITRPIHYYHMVEFFQRLTNLPVVIHSDEDETIVKFGEEYLYFQIGCPIEQLYDPSQRPQVDENTEFFVFAYDSFGLMEIEKIGNVERGKSSSELNMAYYSGELSVMPIGSSLVPFVGQLDGKGLTVSNLSVVTSGTVNIHKYNAAGEVTETISDVRRTTCDVGIFGYIGASGIPNGESEPVVTSVKNVYFDNVTIDLSDLDVTAIESEVDGLPHTNTAAIHNDETCYAGYIAGHLSLSSLIQDVYVNNATFVGGNAASIGFGYFGCVETSDGAPVATLGSEIATLRSKGDDAGFGGSIDMRGMFDRLDGMNGNPATTVRNVTAELITIDEVAGTTDTQYTYANANAQADGNTVYYYAQDESGSYYMFSRSSGTAWHVYYLYGENGRTNTKVITTYVYKDEYSDAMYIRDGERYLAVNGTTLSSVTAQGSAAKWLEDDQGHLYTLVDVSGGPITRYYLNRNGAGVTIGTNAATIWHHTASDASSYTSDLYLTDNGVNYYLDYNGGWVLTRFREYRTISDGQGHYLSANGTDVTNAASAAASVKWSISDPMGATTTISAEFSGVIRYLDGSDGSLKMSAASTTWNRDGNTFYINVLGIRYNLVYDGNWKVLPASGKRITDGSGHFLTADTSGVSNAAQAAAVVWQFSNESGNTQIYTIINGQRYYLTVTGAALGVSTAATTWNRVGNAFYMTSGGKDYYLAYADGEWKVILLDYFTINDGSGNYLRVTGNNAFANGNSSTATHFYFTTENGANSSGRAYCVVDGTTYYLYNDNGTLQTTTTQNTGTQWSNDGSSLYVTSGNTVYALRYDTTWNIKAIYEGRYITDGTNYMTVTGTTIGNTTDPDEATVFIFSNNGANPAGTITVAGTTNYLRNNNGTLQISGTSTTWTNDGTRLYTGNNNNRRNLGFYSGSWQMTGSNTTTVTSSLGYTIGYNGHYLCVDSSGNISDTTTAANASLWSGTSGQIYTTVNGTNYYLYRNGTTLSTTTDANNATNWTNYNNKLYYRTSNGLLRYDFYYVTYNSAWTIGTSINVTNNNGRNACTTLTITQQNETITIVSRAVSSDTTRPVVYVTPETAAAPALTVNSFTAAGTAISFSDAVTEEVTFEETTVQTVLKTVETGLDSGYPTYFPIRIARSGESDYNQAAPYKASEKNTGYIVSGGNFYDGSTTGTKVGDIRISEYAISNIEGSYSTTGLTVTKIAQGGNYLYLEKLQDDTYRIANTTNASIADFWQYSDSKLFTTIGKTTYYLTYSGGLALATNVSNAVNWTFSNNNRLAYNNNYIRYNNGWTTGAANQGNLTLTLGTLNLNNIYTYDGSGNHTLTQAQKTEAFSQAALQLSQTLVGSTNVYGLHFMNAEISLDHLVTAKTANIFGNHYVDYELPEDSIDFNVIERGTINFFAGEYFNGNNAFFSLHQVFRYKETDPEVVAGTKKANDIKDIKEIIYVYKTTENGDRNPYVYYYGDGTYTNADGSYSGATQLPSGYTITFRTSWITNPSGLQTDNNATNKKVYYFEIPCNDGEYCLGSVAGKTGAYLIYLDIAANGGDTVASAISSTGNDVTNTFAVEFRSEPDTMPHSVLMFSIEVPDNAKDKISISTSFDKTDTDPPHQNGLYTINIVNNSTEDLTIYVYLCDDDYNLTTAFQYAYQIKYSNGSQTDDYVTTAVGSVFQMMAGFVIPSTGAATEVSYH